MEAIADAVAWITDPARWGWGGGTIPFRVVQHLQLALVPTMAAAAIAVPTAAWLAHRRRAEFLATAVVNVGRAIPSFGVLVVAALLAIRWGVSVSFWPGVVALLLLALPPVFTNTYAGVAGADPATVESGRGMGMTSRQLLLGVELPLGSPVILAGIRIALLQVVATVPLIAVVGPSGGLGRYIIDGFAQGRAGRPQVLAGAVLVAALTFVSDLAYGRFERALLPDGLGQIEREDVMVETGVMA